MTDCHARNKILTATLLQQGHRYHNLRKTVSKFYRRHYELVSKFKVGFKSLFATGHSSLVPFYTNQKTVTLLRHSATFETNVYSVKLYLAENSILDIVDLSGDLLSQRREFNNIIFTLRIAYLTRRGLIRVNSLVEQDVKNFKLIILLCLFFFPLNQSDSFPSIVNDFKDRYSKCQK